MKSLTSGLELKLNFVSNPVLPADLALPAHTCLHTRSAAWVEPGRPMPSLSAKIAQARKGTRGPGAFRICGLSSGRTELKVVWTF